MDHSSSANTMANAQEKTTLRRGPVPPGTAGLNHWFGTQTLSNQFPRLNAVFAAEL